MWRNSGDPHKIALTAAALLERRAGKHGVPGLVIDQPGSIAQLVLAVAARRQVPVAYVPGLVMRRAADLYPGEARTDRRDAYIIADTARTRRKQVHWLEASSDELLAQLRVLNGFDTDLAADQTRIANRLRDALTSIASLPGIEDPRRVVRTHVPRTKVPQCEIHAMVSRGGALATARTWRRPRGRPRWPARAGSTSRCCGLNAPGGRATSGAAFEVGTQLRGSWR
jgi:hypothetical protein